MSEAPLRRFPLVSGPYGWAAAALMLAAVGCQLVAVLALVWLALNKDPSMVALWIVVLLVSFPLGAAALALWRVGWKRAGTLPPSSVPKERRQELRRAIAVMVLGSALGIGGFLYLAFRLEGSRRLSFAFAALFLGTAISEIGAKKMSEILRRPFPSFLGWSPKGAWVIAVGFSLVLSGLFVLIGFFWPDLMPIQQGLFLPLGPS